MNTPHSLTEAQPNRGANAENVRLVIWDLDETFWHGTLAEGGITYRRDLHDVVIELARRGIVSSICSKNDLARVREIFEREGLWDYFVFPSIDWTPKGTRLAALIRAIQLRPETVLFIDDNPMNLAEARHETPGLQIAGHEFADTLLDDPRLRGRDDPMLARLEQYRLLQRRHSDSVASNGDNTAFLRGSRIRVSIEHDIEPHLDRAIELINRTNQLNFTKSRLPEVIEEARSTLRALLSRHNVQAGLIRVRDRYGDHGYCGLYVLDNARLLRHFCFSCRILNMGVETWLYRELGSPVIAIKGDVLTDLAAETGPIDWITVERSGIGQDDDNGAKLDYFFARGGCDALAISHYFRGVARRCVVEVGQARNMLTPIVSHSQVTRYAITGLSDTGRVQARLFGYADEDFSSLLSDVPPDERGVWLLSFALDVAPRLYRSKATGELFPVQLPRVRRQLENLLVLDSAITGIDPALLAAMQADFDFVGPIPDDLFLENLRMIFSRATANAHVFVLLGNDLALTADGRLRVAEGMRQRNALVGQAALDYPAVELIAVSEFIPQDAAPEAKAGNHHDRIVYFRLFEHIMKRVDARSAAAAAHPA